jgi:NAD(P)-dependent dehydrogenase (short-subunit alcohol dehydrogenase family)
MVVTGGSSGIGFALAALVHTPLGPDSATLVPPGAASVPNDRTDGAMRGATSPTVVAEAAIDAVESGPRYPSWPGITAAMPFRRR